MFSSIFFSFCVFVVTWQVVEYSGLIWTPDLSNITEDDIQLNSGYYAVMQFSKYIRKGFHLVHISDWNSVAAYDDDSHTLVIVTVNSESNVITKSIDLRSFETLGEIYAVRTSQNEPHVAIPPPDMTNRQITYEFIGQSVTTIKITGAVPRLTDNLIKNGDFEYTGNLQWTLLFGARDDNGINSNYVYRGSKSGFLDFTTSKLSLVQNITISQSRTFYLSAWCATDGPSTLFGTLVNGLQGPEVTIVPSKGYQLYGLSIDAKVSDVITVFLHSEQGNYTAQIDDVIFH